MPRLPGIGFQSFKPTAVHHARAETSSEAVSLKGKKALTPIIAGSVCGGLMGLAWIIGFSVYFWKRYKRKQRNRLIAIGKAAPREKDLKPPEEKIVIPPDPAVLLGQRKPGEDAFPDGRPKHIHRSTTKSYIHQNSRTQSRTNSMAPSEKASESSKHVNHPVRNGNNNHATDIQSMALDT
ncbi:hypothetical protein BDQ12DRAFT_730418 [Crucibulum laeve]|uniref:Uncharacterized protein n=1 Tax=Crucibulum laeve TaxID=68775 RepID=A0A5C3MG09_9AGAR|nr:hypothetical protein BDQ12DRAFT_730418 [Crucibulum laeve]